MKKHRGMLIVMISLALLAMGCAKKTMENQGGVEQDVPPQPEQQEEAAVQVEPEQDTQAMDAERDRLAAQNRFVSEYIYFDFDSAVLRSDAMETLRAKAEWLEANGDVNLLVIEGHCDERGTEAYNMALGAKRAEAVKQYLTDLGLAAHRFQIQSYGEERPLDISHNEEAWSKNRRAAFVINQ